MTLGQLLTPDHILPSLMSPDGRGAIDEMADHLFALQAWPSAVCQSLRQRLHQREAVATTAIGTGVAIPHALCPHLDEPAALLARSAEGLAYPSPDVAPVHLLVLFVVPERQYRARLEILSAIGKALSSPTLRQRLLAAPTAAAMHHLLCGRLTPPKLAPLATPAAV